MLLVTFASTEVMECLPVPKDTKEPTHTHTRTNLQVSSFRHGVSLAGIGPRNVNIHDVIIMYKKTVRAANDPATRRCS